MTRERLLHIFASIQVLCLRPDFTNTDRALFFASTTMTAGNGQTALFWEDRWINGQAISDCATVVCVHFQATKESQNVADGLQDNARARGIQGDRLTGNWAISASLACHTIHKPHF
jgi:hypothetical protein